MWSVDEIVDDLLFCFCSYTIALSANFIQYLFFSQFLKVMNLTWKQSDLHLKLPDPFPLPISS